MTNLNRDQILSLVRMMYELDHYADVVIIDTGAGISDAVILSWLPQALRCFW